ncbi:hypothetical protein KZ483_25860 [Paenibacillus sp. sptzw28]|uniref:phospholipase D-like domain-containing protein n=1 Tax=Paenibacillus sp. sptzw28 TaxID=715179 RepID=UPI001C6ED9AD|nr:phospholipase D-like domain-containing protein [Paenibacillus sp. sptzw28]QYR21103.1 hypothetical protein KZ483_25860 [Paenibacillus sp. sptzw28]
MTIRIQQVPYGNELAKFANSAIFSLKVTSPYITFKGIQFILQSEIAPKIITRVTASNLSSYALEGKALKHLLVLGAEIRSIPNLHAKLYLVDETKGIITSSNLTASGFSTNVELGIYFENEDQLFQATNSFFNTLWAKASPVTLESLEKLENQIKSIKHVNGIYRNDELIDEEDIIPVPAIGNLVYNVKEEKSENTHHTEHLQFHYEERDETGDYFAPLPTNVYPLIDNLKSSDDRRIQTVINSLALSSSDDFAQWIENLSNKEFDYLVSPKSLYPYKRYVIRKIIKDGSALHLGLLIKYLVCDISKENQLIIYNDDVTARVRLFTAEEKLELVEVLSEVVEFLIKYINIGQIDRRKNFSKPNLDKINKFIKICGGPTNNINITNKEDIESEKKNVIPGYQEIKRKREALGDNFWDYAEQFFYDLGSGCWNNHLSSINSLFKELEKINLSIEQKKLLRNLANNIVKSMEETIDNVTQKLIKDFTRMTLNKELTSSENEQLKIAFDELKYSTGRLVQIFGQWTKSKRIEKELNVKKKLDFLSTYFLTINTIKKWK